jgi:hypothetical protein
MIALAVFVRRKSRCPILITSPGSRSVTGGPGIAERQGDGALDAKIQLSRALRRSWVPDATAPCAAHCPSDLGGAVAGVLACRGSSRGRGDGSAFLNTLRLGCLDSGFWRSLMKPTSISATMPSIVTIILSMPSGRSPGLKHCESERLAALTGAPGRACRLSVGQAGPT